jgi:hypothetical protein
VTSHAAGYLAFFFVRFFARFFCDLFGRAARFLTITGFGRV